MTNRHVLTGHFRSNDDLQPGSLRIERRDGKTYADIRGHSFGPIEAREYGITRGTTGIEITAPDAAFEFIPDAGECERVGLPVAPAA